MQLMYSEPCSLVIAVFRDLLNKFKDLEGGQVARAAKALL